MDRLSLTTMESTISGHAGQFYCVVSTVDDIILVEICIMFDFRVEKLVRLRIFIYYIIYSTAFKIHSEYVPYGKIYIRPHILHFVVTLRRYVIESRYDVKFYHVNVFHLSFFIAFLYW